MERYITFSTLFLLFLFNQFSYSQNTFQKVIIGGESFGGHIIQKTYDGGYIIVSSITGIGAGGYDVYLMKLNGRGDTIWTKTYGGIYDEGSGSVEQTNDSGFIISGGVSLDSIHSDVYLIKTNSLGDTLWTKAYERTGYDGGASVLQTMDGGYIVLGESANSHAGYDLYIVKTNSVGDTLWTKSYYKFKFPFFYYNVIGHSVTQTPDSNYIVCCESDAGTIFLLKINNQGNILWLKSYDIGLPSQMQQTSDGGFIIFGTTYSTTNFFLLKTDSSGNVIWSKSYGGSSRETSYSGMQTSDGGYIITGGTDSFGAGNTDVYLVKTDSVGDLLWSKAYGDSAFDVGRSVVETNDSGFLVVGFSQSFGSLYSDYFIKTDTNGTSNCREINAGTIVTNINTQQSIDSLGLSSLPSFVKNTSTFVGSGIKLTTLCYTGINEQLARDSSIRIYPNPNNGNFSIKILNDLFIKGEVAIYNSLGKKIFEEPIRNASETKINLTNISSGLYIIMVVSGDKEYLQKVIIE